MPDTPAPSTLIPAPFEKTRARLAFSDVALARGDQAASDGHLTAAHERVSALETVDWVHRVEELLADRAVVRCAERRPCDRSQAGVDCLPP